MADQEDPDRPSFTSFWKRSEEALTGKKITFVQSSSTQAGSIGAGVEQDTEQPAATTAEEKARIRRAQVRKAQIQHRQRKANYVKQLEVDIANIRDMITTTQREVHGLKEENEVMREQIKEAVDQLAMPHRDAPLGPTSSSQAASFLGLSSFENIDLEHLEDITMSLGMDEEMDMPAFQMNNSSMPSHYAPLSHDEAIATEQNAPPVPGMTPEQTQQAINFILALEHICWDHFPASGYGGLVTEPDGTGTESGHTLMATSLALRKAPPAVFDAVARTKANLQQAARRQGQGQGQGQGQRQGAVPAGDVMVSWRSSGLTLDTLRGLAGSANPADLEVTPVQAWFELAAAYPAEQLLRPGVLPALKREFVGVVRCTRYGAVIERGAFDSIVSRVLGPPVFTGMYGGALV